MTYHPGKSTLNYTIAEEQDGKLHTLIWNISNYQTIADCENIRKIETDFVDNITQAHQFRLRINFAGIKHKSIEIYYIYKDNIEVYDAKLQMISEECEKTLITLADYKVTGNNWKHLVSLHGDIVKTAYNVSHGALILKFQFKVTHVVEDIGVFDEPENEQSFDDMLQNGMFSDVILKSADGVEFKTHKVVLAFASRVFRAFFVNDSMENQNIIMESHLTSDVLKEVLIFMYNNEVPRVHEMPDKILEAAEFYNLPELKKIAEEILFLELTADNAIHTLQLAELYNSATLKQLTQKFIRNGHVNVVTKSDDWKYMDSTEILNTTFVFTPKKTEAPNGTA